MTADSGCLDVPAQFVLPPPSRCGLTQLFAEATVTDLNSQAGKGVDTSCAKALHFSQSSIGGMFAQSQELGCAPALVACFGPVEDLETVGRPCFVPPPSGYTCQELGPDAAQTKAAVDAGSVIQTLATFPIQCTICHRSMHSNRTLAFSPSEPDAALRTLQRHVSRGERPHKWGRSSAPSYPLLGRPPRSMAPQSVAAWRSSSQAAEVHSRSNLWPPVLCPLFDS